MTTYPIDEAKLGAFTEHVLGDAAGLMSCWRHSVTTIPTRTSGRWRHCSTGVSIVYCMTTSLAHGGAGLGACGLPRARVEELCIGARFATVRQLDIEDPFNSIYVVRP